MIAPKPDEHGVRWYGRWPGDKRGRPEDTAHCVAAVRDSFTHLSYQCSRRRGHGPKRLYCRQHGKMAERKDRR